MAVLVTGATGTVGRALVARLLAEGRDVRVLTRRPFLAAGMFPAPLQCHEWHPVSEGLPPEALAGVTSVVHLAGAPLAGGRFRGRAAHIAASREIATRRIAEAIAGRPIRLVVTSFVSSGSLDQERLDHCPDSSEIVAGTATAALPPSASPVAPPGEAEAAAAAVAGASVAIVRLGLLAAPGPLLAGLVALARLGLVPRLDGARIPAVDPADVAAMLAGLVGRLDLTGTFLGVAPAALPGEALAAALIKAAPAGLAAPAPVRLLERRLGRLAALLAIRDPLVPRRLIDAGAAFTSPDPTLLVEAAVAHLIAARPPPALASWWAVRRERPPRPRDIA